MTVDEIKSKYSMRDVISMYGLNVNRAGFASCPFHGKDKHPSMKIYNRDYHCFTCGANGDIFSFVKDMENTSFKDAFLKLGGTYESRTERQRELFQYHLLKRKEKNERDRQKMLQKKKEVLEDIKLHKIFSKLYPVFSDEWCDAMNRLEYDYYLLNCIMEGSENNY